MPSLPNQPRKFTAVDDDGHEYRIIEYQELADAGNRGAIAQRDAGQRVTRIDRVIYDVEHAFGAVRVTSNDPSVP